MGLYTVAKHRNIGNQTSEAMYAACGIIWRVVADHDRMESEMKRLRGSISTRNTKISGKPVAGITE
jgi:hypothetical protein